MSPVSYSERHHVTLLSLPPLVAARSGVVVPRSLENPDGALCNGEILASRLKDISLVQQDEDDSFICS